MCTRERARKSGVACQRAPLSAVSSPLAARVWQRKWVCGRVRAQGGAMDELGELIPVEHTLAEEILQSASWFNESIWPAGDAPEDEEERCAVVASWMARIRGEPTSTPPARRFAVDCTDRVAAYASLTDEAAAGITDLPDLLDDSLTEEEGCDLMANLLGRLLALRSMHIPAAKLRALLPVWREMATAGRPAGLVHLTVRDSYGDLVPGAPVPPLPPLSDLLPRLQSLDLSVTTPQHIEPWCTMLAGEGAPALAALVLRAPYQYAITDEQAAMYVGVLRRQAGSLRKLAVQPSRIRAGAAEALDAAIVALPHLVNLHTNAVQVNGGSVRVLGGRAPHLRSVAVQCSNEVDPAACLTAWLRELAPSVEQVAIRNFYVHGHARASAPGWDELAVALRAMGARPALRTLLLSAEGVHCVPWLQSVVSPPPDVAAAPVWPHLEELSFHVWSGAFAKVELDLRHFPRLRKIGSNLLSAAAIAGVMRNAVCRDAWLHVTSVSLIAADAAALTPKERLVAGLTASTADETVATLASVVGGWPDLRELKLLSGHVQVSEATQVALVRALGRCTQLRELCLSFPLYPAAAAVIAEALPRLSEVTRIDLDNVTTSSLLVVVRGLLGTGRNAGDAARTLRAGVSGTGDPATTTDDLRELGSVVAVAGQQGWAAFMESNQSAGRTPLHLLSQVQALALRRDWRDCIVPLSTVEVTLAGYTLQLQACGLVEWSDGEWRCQLLPCLLHAPCTCP
jgi:hypothetical protein